MVAGTSRGLRFSSGELSLEGALHLPARTPAPGVVVCHPHPLYGGDMDNNVVVAVCDALVDRGIAALRFNFRGAGGSDGAFDDGRGEQDDVRAALAELSAQPEVDASRVGLIGYSFGAIVSAEVASGSLRALGLISPPLAYADLKVVWGAPAILLGGTLDSLAPPDRLEVVAEAHGVEVCVIEGADHSWWGYEAELGEAIGAFFQRHFG